MWDQRYGEEGFAYGVEPNDFLREQVGAFAPGAAVLCLAEGEGRNAVYLAERGCEVTAVDLSPVGLAKAEKFAAERGASITTVAADLSAYDLGEARWDGVVSVWAHVPPAVRGPLHRRVVRALKPGGVLLLEAYTPKQLEHGTGGPPKAELMMTLAGLREELAGLEIELGREVEREIHEGRYHDGMSATVQLLARKPAA